MKKQQTIELIDSLKFKTTEQEKNRPSFNLEEVEEQAIRIIKNELSQSSLTMLEMYAEDSFVILDSINQYITVEQQNSTYDFDKTTSYGKAGEKLFSEDRFQESMIAYKRSIECGNFMTESSNTFFKLNFYNIPYIGIGRIFEQENKHDKAIAFYTYAINMKVDFPRIEKELNCLSENLLSYYAKQVATAYLHKAQLLKKLGLFDAAQVNFDEAIGFNKFLYSAYLDKAECLKELKKLDDADTTYDQLIKVNHSYIDAYYFKSEVLGTKGEYKAQIEALDNYITLKHNNNKSILNINFAELYFKKAAILENLKQIPESDFYRGLTFYCLNALEKAIIFFEEAIKRDNDNNNSNSDNVASYYFYKGCSLAKLNSFEKEFEANDCFHKAYEKVANHNIRILLDAFIHFNSKVVEGHIKLIEEYNDEQVYTNLNKLISNREYLIKEFTNKILPHLKNEHVLDGNINNLIENISKLNINPISEINPVNIVYEKISLAETDNDMPPIGNHEDLNNDNI